MRYRFGDIAGAEAAGANAHCPYSAVSKLMARLLQVGGETAFGLDVGMADKISGLRFFAAKITFFTHFISPLSLLVWFGRPKRAEPRIGKAPVFRRSAEKNYFPASLAFRWAI